MKAGLFVSFMFLFFCCNNRAGSEVEVLAKPKMATVLWDMIKVDEFSGMYIIADTTKNLKMERMKLYKQVFALHKVSNKEFFSSYKYYAAHPVDMKEIFDTLNVRAEREKLQVNTHQKDSLR